jgi:hypothetical protein
MVLTEIVMNRHQIVASLVDKPPFFVRLLRYIKDSNSMDMLMTLMQEIFASTKDAVRLSTLRSLPLVIQNFTPRQLSMFNRVVAVLCSKTSEDHRGLLPPPECVPPDLCATCCNSNFLVSEIECFIPRLVLLLTSELPAKGVLNSQLVSASDHSHTFEDESDDASNIIDQWKKLKNQIGGELDSSAPNAWSQQPTTVMLPRSQVPPTILATEDGDNNQYDGDDTVSVSLTSLEKFVWAQMQAGNIALNNFLCIVNH